MEHEQARGRTRWSPAVAGALVAALVVALVAGVVALPRLLAEDEPAPTGVRPVCVDSPDAPAGAIGEQEATWVRFCPLADEGAAQRVRHPQGVITGGLAASVAATLAQTEAGRPVCTAGAATPGPTGLFRIEVGLADGRVAELDGDTGCSTRDELLFSQLETTLLMEAAAGSGPPSAAPAPVTCPERFTTTATNRDGASAPRLAGDPATVPLLPLPAVAVDVCAYSGSGEVRRLADQWQVGPPTSEQVRAAATLQHVPGAMADCEPAPGLTSYVIVLTDATGTARTLTLDPTACSPLRAAVGTPPVDTHLGLATQRLVRLVARIAP
ncbi:hypothetical protein [Nocardioides renjunii]|uniref:hypothetical protein n=1 Tax=Nocardioides renjunii TaxID=3095075 RepID=UPI002AFFDF30|nr:hypothetical protein [Nocardioides sp. S-34]WQQ22168.1 hypothetical protein SHK17_20050 [Nocardioides sp. S-34]